MHVGKIMCDPPKTEVVTIYAADCWTSSL